MPSKVDDVGGFRWRGSVEPGRLFCGGEARASPSRSVSVTLESWSGFTDLGFSIGIGFQSATCVVRPLNAWLRKSHPSTLAMT